MKKIFFVTAVLFSSYAYAQQDTIIHSLDEVIVTANRIQQKQSSTGKVVTVIGRDVLNRSQGSSVAQILNDQAGITINGALNNAGTVQTTYMRGAASGRVLILLDGIPVNDPSQINNEFDLNLLSVNDVERIEIARGAQSTLYGSDASAGVINIITQSANADGPLQGRSTIIGGNYGTLRTAIKAGGTISKLEYQIRQSYSRTNGFSSANDQTGNADFDKDGFSGQNFGGSLKYNATEQLSLKGFVQMSQYRATVDNGTFKDDKDFTQKNRSLNAGGGFVFKKSAFSLTGNYMFTQTKRNYLDDSTDIGGFNKYSRDDYSSKNHFAELFLSVELCKGLTLLQGVDYRYQSFNNNFTSVSSFGPFNSSFKDTFLTQQSIYGSLIYNGLNKKLNVELGARLNENSRYGSNHTFTFNPSYSINDRYRIFGSIATGFKTPSLYQLYDAYAGNIKLRPEESITYEAGIEENNKNVRQRAVFFYRETKTGIDFDYVNFKYYNIPNQIVRGIEYELTMTPVKNLQFTLNYTLLKGTEFVQSRITQKDTSYGYLLKRPDHSMTVNAGYTLKNKWYFSLNARAVSKRYDVGGYQVPDELLNPYVIFGAYGSYQFNNKLKFFAEGRNITNVKFFDIRGFNSIPVMVQGGLTLEW